MGTIKKTFGKCFFFNCLLESYSIMQYSKVFVQTVLEIKVVRSSKKIWRLGGKQVFPDTCSFKFVSCFNVLNHTLEYCRVLTKLSVLNSKCNLTIRETLACGQAPLSMEYFLCPLPAIVHSNLKKPSLCFNKYFST